MPDTSPNLALPYLLPAQAQKHVTHNEALARLDLLVQLVVTGFDALTPPATPEAGDIHALGAAPLGDWAGQGGKLAAWDGTAWGFITPRTGWRAWGLTEGALRILRGTAWEPMPFDNLDGLGVGTAHDATNRLAVVAPATLLTHAGAGHQVKVNKATATDTASLLFQSNWSGRAEMGLAGSDDFSLKVSADGGSWLDALQADRTTGRLRLPGGARLPDGSAASPALAFDAGTNTGLFRSAANALGLAVGGVQRALLSATALQLSVPLTGTAVTQAVHDTTAGRLVKAGDYGWGQAGNSQTNALLNSILTSGVHQFGSPATGETNSPISTGGAVLVIRYSTSWVTQIVFEANGTNAHMRRTQDNGTTWSGWVRILNQGNLLGAVSQSAGVPTGALFETGSNANGRYERRADGYLECFHTLTASATAATTWTFPSAFAEPPVVSITPIATLSSAPALDAAPTTTAASFSCRDKTDARRADGVHLRAIGRWSTMA